MNKRKLQETGGAPSVGKNKTDFRAEKMMKKKKKKTSKIGNLPDVLHQLSSHKVMRKKVKASSKIKRNESAEQNGHSSSLDSNQLSHVCCSHVPQDSISAPHICRLPLRCASISSSTSKSRKANIPSEEALSVSDGLCDLEANQCHGDVPVCDEHLSNSGVVQKRKSCKEQQRSWTPEKRQRLAVELSTLLSCKPVVPSAKLSGKKKSSRKSEAIKENSALDAEGSITEVMTTTQQNGNMASVSMTEHPSMIARENGSVTTDLVYCNPRADPHVELCRIPSPQEYVALDCEFVGVGPNKTSALGRCSIVNFHGCVLYDKVVIPEAPITDYRTPWSGLRKNDMNGAIPFAVAKKQIAQILENHIVIGHALWNDFNVMDLKHDSKRVRDTARSRVLQMRVRAQGSAGRSLRDLTRVLLGRVIQTGEHDSVEDAQAALDLYKLVRNDWEMSILPDTPPPSHRQTPPQALPQPHPPPHLPPCVPSPCLSGSCCFPPQMLMGFRAMAPVVPAPFPVPYPSTVFFEDRFWPTDAEM